jgi:hypothetical protein
LKNFPGLCPGPPLKGRGGKGGRKGERRGLGIQIWRRGVVWDLAERGRDGIRRLIQRKGMGRKEKKESRKEMA